MGRIIVTIPMHPIILALYLLVALPVFLLSQSILAAIFHKMGLGYGLSILLSTNIFFLSLLFSIVNIKVLEISTRTYRLVFERRYIVFYGIPIPMIQPRLLENKVVVAVNVGGALIPLAISIFFTTYIASSPRALAALIASLTATSIATYLVSRAVPGVGIAVPGLVPPLVAVSTTALFNLSLPYMVTVAYVSGSMGSLIGADILRLKKDINKFINLYGPTLLSIGGAGTFDGIYLSGVLAVVLAIAIA